MDTLVLKGLQFDNAYHGFYNNERREGNRFEIDIKIEADLRDAGKNDDLRKTINYEMVCREVKSVMEGPSKKLIETLAQTIGERLFNTLDKANTIVVSLRKISPPLDVTCSYSEISMQWQR